MSAPPPYSYLSDERHSLYFRICATVFILAIFILESTFRIREYDNKNVDFQIVLKLISWIFIFCLAGLGNYRAIISSFGNYLGIALWLVLTWFFISCFYAPNTMYSVAAVVSLVAFYVAVQAMIARFGEVFFPYCLIYAVTLVCTLSIIFYFAKPEVGRTFVWLGGRLTETDRMSGIAGAATVLGNIVSVAILLGIIYYKELLDLMSARRLNFMLFLFSFILIMTQSRGSALSLILCLFIFFFVRRKHFGFLVIATLYMSLIAAVIVLNYEYILPIFTRSGDINEILTATNRTAIWIIVWSLIGESPVFGWGYASSLFILPGLEMQIGEAAPHTHNMLLQVMFSGGVIGLILFSVLLVSTVLKIAQSRNMRAAVLFLYINVLGLTQAGPFQGLANYSYIILIFIICLVGRKATRRRDFEDFDVTVASVPPSTRISDRARLQSFEE